MDEFIGLLIAVIVALATAVFTTVIVDNGWENDCMNLGAHRINNTAYDCKLKITPAVSGQSAEGKS